jgi:hypothetical protein
MTLNTKQLALKLPLSSKSAEFCEDSHDPDCRKWAMYRIALEYQHDRDLDSWQLSSARGYYLVQCQLVGENRLLCFL